MPMYQSRTHPQVAFTVRPDLWPPGSSVDLAWLDKGPQVWLVLLPGVPGIRGPWGRGGRNSRGTPACRVRGQGPGVRLEAGPMTAFAHRKGAGSEVLDRGAPMTSLSTHRP